MKTIKADQSLITLNNKISETFSHNKVAPNTVVNTNESTKFGYSEN